MKRLRTRPRSQKILHKILRGAFVYSLIFSWVFAGFPYPIFDNEKGALGIRNSIPKAHAATLTTLRPTGDGSSSAIQYSTGSTAWNLADDDPDSPNTSDWFGGNTGESAGFVFLDITNMDADFISMDTLQVDIYINAPNGFNNDLQNITAQVFQSNESTALTNVTGTIVSQADSAGLYTATFTGVVASDKTTWDAALLQISWSYKKNTGPDNAYIPIAAVELDGTYTGPVLPDMSGTAYSGEGSGPLTSKAVKVLKNNSTVLGTPTTNGSGVWSLTGVSITSGDIITVFFDGIAEKAVTVLVSDGTTQSDIDLYQNRLILRDDVGSDITNTNLSTGDDGDTDIFYLVSGGDLTVEAGRELHIWTGDTFTPGGTVTLAGDNAASPDGDIHIDNSATFTQNGLITLAGDWAADPSTTFTPDGNGVTFNATTTGKTIAGTLTGTSNDFNAVVFNGSGGEWTFSNNASTTDFTITAGTVIATTFLSISGDYTNNGSFTDSSGTVLFDGGSAQTLGGTMNTTATDFANVIFSGAGTKTFGANSASTTSFTIDATSGDVTAPSTYLSLAGAYDNTSGGVFVHNSGTVLFETGSSITSGSAMIDTSAFNNVEFLTSITFNDNASTTNFTITSGTVTAPPALLTVAGAYNNSNGGTFANNSGTVYLATGVSLVSGSNMVDTSAFNSLELLTSVTFNDNASTTNLTITSGTLTAPSLLTVAGNYSNSGTFTHSSGLVYFSGASKTLGGTMTGSSAFNNLEFLNSGSWTFNAAATANDFTITSGTVTAPTGTLTLGGNYSNSGTFDSTTGTVSMTGSSKTFSGTLTGTSAFNVLSFTNSGSWTFNANASTTNFTITSGTVTAPASGYLSVSGNYSNSGTYTNNIATLLFDGGSGQSLSGTMIDSSALGYVLFTGAGTKSFGANSASTTDFTIDATSGDVTAPSTLLTVAGDYSNSATFANNSGTVLFASTSAQSLSGTMIDTSAFNNVEFYGAGIKTYDANASSTDFTILAGTVIAPTLLSISGNYTNSGIFTAGTGTTTFNGAGAQTLSGTMIDASAFDNIEFIGAGTKSFGSNSASTTDFTIQSGSGAVTAPSTVLSITGNYLNNGTFTHNSGTTTFNGVTLQILTGTLTSFNNISLANTYSDYPNPSVYFSSIASTTGTLELLSLGAGDPVIQMFAGATSTIQNLYIQGNATYDIHLHSTSAGTQFGIEVPGTRYVDYAHLTDANACSDLANISTTNSVSGGNSTCWDGVSVELVYSGTLFSNEGSIQITSGKNITVRVATSTPGVFATTTNSGAGTWQVTVLSTGIDAGVPISVWVGGDATTRAFTQTKASDALDIFGIDLYQNRVIVKHEAVSATSTTNIDLASYDNDDDPDIQFTSNGGVLTVFADQELHIWTGDTFAPGGAVTVTGNASSTTDGSIHIDDSATFTQSGLITLAGNWDSDPSTIFTPDTSGVLFNATTTGKTIAGTLTGTVNDFDDVTFNGSGGGWTFSNNASTTDFIITAGTVVTPTLLTIGGNYSNSGTFTAGTGTTTFSGSGSQTLSGTMTGTSAFDNVEFTGANAKSFGANSASTTNFTIDSTAGNTVTAPSTLLTVAGDYSNSATFTHNGGTIFFASTSAQSISGIATGTSAFNNVEFSGSGAKTFNVNASTTNFTIVSGSGAVMAPTILSISGDYSNSGTFTAGTGTTTLSGTSQQTLSGSMLDTSAFANLEITNTSGADAQTDPSIIFSSAASTTGTFWAAIGGSKIRFPANATSTLTDIYIKGDGSNRVFLRSSSGGTAFGLVVPGIQRLMTYVDVADSNACYAADSEISATDGTSNDSGGNTCWCLITGGCSLAIASNANQVFEVGQASAVVSDITITESPTVTSITASNDIRIAIATSTHDMRWDNTVSSITASGSAVPSKVVASPSVTYEGGDSVVVIPVGTSFSTSDAITISGLKLTNFNTATTAAAAIIIYTGGANDQTTDATDDKTIAIKGALVLGDHDSGQVGNVFTGNSISSTAIFALKVTLSGEDVSIPSLSFPLSGVSGFVSGDITNALLYIDYDGDGVIDGEDIMVGGSGTPTITDDTGTIAFSTSFTATTTRNYVLIVDIADINPSDLLTISLPATNISGTGATSTETITSTGSVTERQHARSAGSGGSVGSSAPAGASVEVGGDDDAGETIGSEPGFEIPSTTGDPLTQWATPSNTYDSVDGTYATEDTTSEKQDYATFTFSIPGGNTVNGIEVKLEANSSSTAAGSIDVDLSWDGGTSYTSVKSTGTLTTSDVVYTLGSASDDWGHTPWTPTELNDTNFRIRITGQPSSNTVRVDAIQVKVHHVAGGGGGGGGGEVRGPASRFFAGVYKAVESIIEKLLQKLLS